MNVLQLQTNYLTSNNSSDNVNLYTTTTGNIISGAATTNIFSLNSKSIQLNATTTTSLTGNIVISGNTTTTGNINVGSTNIISADNIQAVAPSDTVNLYTTATGNIIAGAATTNLFSLNAKSIQLTGPTTHTGNVAINGNVVLTGNITVGSNTISSPSFVLTGNVGNVAGANLTFGVASSSGSYSSTAITGDVVIRSSGSNNMILQTGQGGYGLKIDSSNNVYAQNFIFCTRLYNTVDLRVYTASGNTLYLNNDKTSGDIRINTGSTTSNTYIDNGTLNIASGYINIASGYGVLFPNNAAIGYAATTAGYSNNAGIGDLIIRSSPSQNLILQTGYGNAAFRIDSANNIYIYGLLAQQSGGWSIDSSGNAYFFTLHVNGNNVTSDYRIKSNVRPVEKTIDNLRPVSYFHKKLEKESHGFIAHEVAEHFPELVTGEKDAVDEKGEPKYQAIDYIGLIAVLTKEIQDMRKTYSKEINDLKQRIVVLENQ